MNRKLWTGGAFLAAALGVLAIVGAGGTSGEAPAGPASRSLASMPNGSQSIVFAGGCFWGVQAVFQHVRGVELATSGYAGGSAETASYQLTSTGRTGHAESVRVVYDPSVVSLDQLLDVFFTVAHDPTQLNRQGPDVGPQYRSAIFTTSEEQAAEVRAYIEKLERSHEYSKPIVTRVNPLEGFYPAEDYHQDYLIRHPNSLYIRINDVPKVRHLEKDYPQLWRDETAPWKAPEGSNAD
ncbi:MAG: peptide-methionine (S)-S-oxide reductase MsrA [Gemmatimonadales bacterium]